jgi:hypothetical protein
LSAGPEVGTGAFLFLYGRLVLNLREGRHRRVHK